MTIFKKFTSASLLIFVVSCLWTGWFIFSGEQVFFGYAYVYAASATAFFWSFLLAKIVSNHSYVVKMLLVALPYVIWCIWFASLGLEESNPGLAATLLIVSIVVFMFASLIMSWDVQTIDADLLAKGERALAQVLAISDNGMTVNDNLISVTLTLSVQSQSRGEFPITYKQLISRLSIPRVGEQVTVLFDPNNLKTMMIAPPNIDTKAF